MNKELINTLEAVASVLHLCSSTCQDWKTLPTLEHLNNINRLMRANMETVRALVIVRLEIEKQQ